MIDLETLGTKPNSVLVALGVATSNGGSYYAVIDVESCIAAGLRTDIDTVQWWMRQSDTARFVFHPDHPKESLASVLTTFTEGLKTMRQAEGSKTGIRLWGNSAGFDLGLLGNAYDALQLPRPWKYWEEACYRTLKNLRKDIKAPEFKGIKHNALADAQHQLEHLMLLLEAVKAP